MNHKEDTKTVEDLVIYKQFIELIYYTESILMKFPKCERFALASTIKNTTYEGMRYVLNAFKEYSNYAAWGKKLANIGNLLGGWMKSCLKQ